MHGWCTRYCLWEILQHWVAKELLASRITTCQVLNLLDDGTKRALRLESILQVHGELGLHLRGYRVQTTTALMHKQSKTNCSWQQSIKNMPACSATSPSCAAGGAVPAPKSPNGPSIPMSIEGWHWLMSCTSPSCECWTDMRSMSSLDNVPDVLVFTQYSSSVGSYSQTLHCSTCYLWSDPQYKFDQKTCIQTILALPAFALLPISWSCRYDPFAAHRFADNPNWNPEWWFLLHKC